MPCEWVWELMDRVAQQESGRIEIQKHQECFAPLCPSSVLCLHHRRAGGLPSVPP